MRGKYPNGDYKVFMLSLLKRYKKNKEMTGAWSVSLGTATQKDEHFCCEKHFSFCSFDVHSTLEIQPFCAGQKMFHVKSFVF